MINKSTRRDFLKTTTLATFACLAPATDLTKYRPLLSFATLGCPDWSLEKMLDFAAENEYDGIEFRGLQRQFDLTKCPAFNSRENILASSSLIKEKKIKIVDLGSSAVMHHSDPGERAKNLDEAKRFIQLARQLDCPYVRVFADKFSKEREREETIDLIIKGLRELGTYAADTGITVLLSTHGDIIHTADIAGIMEAVGLPNMGIGWDVVNIWAETKEPVAAVYAKLKKYIRLVHIKDLKFVDGKEQNVLPGRGDAPIFEAIDILARDGYNGYYSFLWEKYWFPEIEDPEIAFADYSKLMRRHFKKM